MARLNKAENTSLYKKIASAHDFLDGYVATDEPTQYPQPGTRLRAHHLDHALSFVKHKLAGKAGVDDGALLGALSYGQFLRAQAHEHLDCRFPVREQDAQDYAEVAEVLDPVYQGLRLGLGGFHEELHSYLRNNRADNETLESLADKNVSTFFQLIRDGLDASEARAKIKETLPDVNTSYPTIDDVEASWKNLSEGVKALQGNSNNVELVERVADAGREYMGIMRRLHDFYKY